MKETEMSEYIKGFDAGYAYVLTQIERHPRLTTAEILRYLRGEKVEIGPSILPTRDKENHCD
jgi:diketogulonate reductase-like aldo/keto reductase